MLDQPAPRFMKNEATSDTMANCKLDVALTGNMGSENNLSDCYQLTAVRLQSSDVTLSAP